MQSGPRNCVARERIRSRDLQNRNGSKPFRKIVCPHEAEQTDKRRFTLTKYDRAPAHDHQTRSSRARFYARELGRFKRKHAREKTTRSHVRGCRCAIVRDGAAQFKPAGDTLRMFALHTGL